jgi:hypothetical protein
MALHQQRHRTGAAAQAFFDAKTTRQQIAGFSFDGIFYAQIIWPRQLIFDFIQILKKRID